MASSGLSEILYLPKHTYHSWQVSVFPFFNNNKITQEKYKLYNQNEAK